MPFRMKNYERNIKIKKQKKNKYVSDLGIRKTL